MERLVYVLEPEHVFEDLIEDQPSLRLLAEDHDRRPLGLDLPGVAYRPESVNLGDCPLVPQPGGPEVLDEIGQEVGPSEAGQQAVGLEETDGGLGQLGAELGLPGRVGVDQRDAAGLDPIAQLPEVAAVEVEVVAQLNRPGAPGEEFVPGLLVAERPQVAGR